MLSNEYLIQLLKTKIKESYRIYWLCYDWKNEGLRPIFSIIEDIKCNYERRKWCRKQIKLLKAELLASY